MMNVPELSDMRQERIAFDPAKHKIPSLPDWMELTRPFDIVNRRVRQKEPTKKRYVKKHTGPPSTWGCKVEGCNDPRYIRGNGRVEARCKVHLDEYYSRRR